MAWNAPPVTPTGKTPLRLVTTPEAGVPSAGVTSVGLVSVALAIVAPESAVVSTAPPAWSWIITLSPLVFCGLMIKFAMCYPAISCTTIVALELLLQ